MHPWEVPVHYQVRVRGRLSKTLLGAFPELRAQVQGSQTLLAGQLPDQAALFGVLEVLRTEDE